MKVGRFAFLDIDTLEDYFYEVAQAWGLSPSEREAVRGEALIFDRSRSRRSRFLIERMALVVEIDWLLGGRMDAAEIQRRVRRRVAGVVGSSPLDDLVGSTDRLRRIRALLAMDEPG